MQGVWCLHYKAAVTPQLQEYEYFAVTIDYFRYFIWPRRLELAEHTTNDIAKLQHLTMQKRNLLSFGMCNMYRRFIPNLADRFAPPNKTLSKKQPNSIDVLDKTNNTLVVSLKDALIIPSGLDVRRGNG